MEKKDKTEENVKEIKKKYLKLKKEINIHNKLYYDQNNPKISDSKYDKLWKELKNLEETFAFLETKDSPILKVGHKPNQKFSKVKHNQPMLSLENALNLDEVKKYIEKIMRYLNIKNQFIELIAEPKIDGLSIALKYKKGKFISGATRGDGQVGEDVTLSLETIQDIPREKSELKNIDLFEVRGEIYMKKEDFLVINDKTKKKG